MTPSRTGPYTNPAILSKSLPGILVPATSRFGDPRKARKQPQTHGHDQVHAQDTGSDIMQGLGAETNRELLPQQNGSMITEFAPDTDTPRPTTPSRDRREAKNGSQSPSEDQMQRGRLIQAKDAGEKNVSDSNKEDRPGNSLLSRSVSKRRASSSLSPSAASPTKVTKTVCASSSSDRAATPLFASPDHDLAASRAYSSVTPASPATPRAGPQVLADSFFSPEPSATPTRADHASFGAPPRRARSETADTGSTTTQIVKVEAQVPKEGARPSQVDAESRRIVRHGSTLSLASRESSSLPDSEDVYGVSGYFDAEGREWWNDPRHQVRRASYFKCSSGIPFKLFLAPDISKAFKLLLVRYRSSRLMSSICNSICTSKNELMIIALYRCQAGR